MTQREQLDQLKAIGQTLKLYESQLAQIKAVDNPYVHPIRQHLTAALDEARHQYGELLEDLKAEAA